MRLVSHFFPPRNESTSYCSIQIPLKIYNVRYPAAPRRKVLDSTLFPSGKRKFNSAVAESLTQIPSLVHITRDHGGLDEVTVLS